MATIKARVSSLIYKQIDDFGKAMEQNGASKDEVQKATKYLNDVASKYMYRSSRRPEKISTYRSRRGCKCASGW